MAACVIWLVAEASPAAAYVCRFGIASPGAGSISGSSTVHVTGPFEVKGGEAERVVEVTFTVSPGQAPPPAVVRGDSVGPTGTYDVPLGPLSLNGRYTARIKAVHNGTGVLNCDDGLGTDRRDTAATADISFGVSVRANPPKNVKATFDPAARTASVTWERSGDPDIAGHTITRKVGSGPATSRSVPPDALAWTDKDLPAGAASITYSVQASRNGPDVGTTSEPSAPVAAAALAVPAAPTPSSTPLQPRSGGPGSGATATSAPFMLGRPVPGSVGRAFVPIGDLNLPAAADGQGGYQPLIPYPPSIGSAEGIPPLEDREQAVAGSLSDEGERGDGTPGLAYVAAGLLSSVVAAHVLWLRKQALRPEPAGVRGQVPLEALAPEPEPPPPAEPTAATAAGSPFKREVDAGQVPSPNGSSTDHPGAGIAGDARETGEPGRQPPGGGGAGEAPSSEAVRPPVGGRPILVLRPKGPSSS